MENIESMESLINVQRKTVEALRDKARGHYTKISNYFIKSEEFTGYEKLVYIAILMHFMRKDNCFPSIATLAKYARCGRTSVNKAIKNLEAKKMIKKDRRMNGSNSYLLINELLPAATRLSDDRRPTLAWSPRAH